MHMHAVLIPQQDNQRLSQCVRSGIKLVAVQYGRLLLAPQSRDIGKAAAVASNSQRHHADLPGLSAEPRQKLQGDLARRDALWMCTTIGSRCLMMYNSRSGIASDPATPVPDKHNIWRQASCQCVSHEEQRLVSRD